MKEFVSRLESGGGDETFTEKIKKYPLKNFEASISRGENFRFGKKTEVQIQRDILGKLVSLSSEH